MVERKGIRERERERERDGEKGREGRREREEEACTICYSLGLIWFLRGGGLGRMPWAFMYATNCSGISARVSRACNKND